MTGAGSDETGVGGSAKAVEDSASYSSGLVDTGSTAISPRFRHIMSTGFFGDDTLVDSAGFAFANSCSVGWESTTSTGDASGPAATLIFDIGENTCCPFTSPCSIANGASLLIAGNGGSAGNVRP